MHLDVNLWLLYLNPLSPWRPWISGFGFRSGDVWVVCVHRVTLVCCLYFPRCFSPNWVLLGPASWPFLSARGFMVCTVIGRVPLAVLLNLTGSLILFMATAFLQRTLRCGFYDGWVSRAPSSVTSMVGFLTSVCNPCRTCCKKHRVARLCEAFV